MPFFVFVIGSHVDDRNDECRIDIKLLSEILPSAG